MQLKTNETAFVQHEIPSEVFPSGASGDIILSASAPTWAVTLQFFTITGSIPFELFILTRNSLAGKCSELYYFQETAETAFFRWILQYETENLS